MFHDFKNIVVNVLMWFLNTTELKITYVYKYVNVTDEILADFG